MRNDIFHTENIDFNKLLDKIFSILSYFGKLIIAKVLKERKAFLILIVIEGTNECQNVSGREQMKSKKNDLI